MNQPTGTAARIPACLDLCYGENVIGKIRDVGFSDATWYGIFEMVNDLGQDRELGRIVEFISFCKHWNERTGRDPMNPPDADEFDRYSGVAESKLWSTRSSQGTVWHLEGAPNFFQEGDISWRTTAGV